MFQMGNRCGRRTAQPPSGKGLGDPVLEREAGGGTQASLCVRLLFPHLQPADSLEVTTGAEQDKLFYQEAMHKLEASQIPAGLQGKQETQWSREGAAFPLCPSYLRLNLKGSRLLAVAGFCRSLWVPTSKPSIIFNNNNPLTCVLWALVFHNLVPLPLSPGVLGKKKARQGPSALLDR